MYYRHFENRHQGLQFRPPSWYFIVVAPGDEFYVHQRGGWHVLFRPSLSQQMSTYSG